jgi:hypothetical protein
MYNYLEIGIGIVIMTYEAIFPMNILRLLIISDLEDKESFIRSLLLGCFGFG